MTNNEVNIIKGAMYTTKNHFMRKVREIPGLTDLVVGIGTPQLRDGDTKVKCTAKWNLHGKEQSLGLDEKMPCVFTITVNSHMGPDAITGKATRKLYKRIYEMATGSKISVPDGDLADMAKDVDAKVVDRASVSLDDVFAGNPENHTPVDQPDKKRRTDAFHKALAALSRSYEGNEKRIDGTLSSALGMELQDIKDDCTDERVIAAVIELAKEF